MKNRGFETSFNIAYCGIICALISIIMFAAVIPSTAYALAAVSGVLVWSVSGQINRKWAFMTYVAASALTLFLTPEPEAKTFFILIFGYYPLLRESAQKIKIRILRAAVKLAVFNAAAVTAYFAVIFLFGVSAKDFLDGLEGFGKYAVYVFWAMGNAAFFFYDFSLKYVMYAYFRWIKPKLNKKIR